MKGLTGVPAVQLTGCKVDYIVDFATNQLAKGYCVVIGLQSTGDCQPSVSPCDPRPSADTVLCAASPPEQTLRALCAQWQLEADSEQTISGRGCASTATATWRSCADRCREGESISCLAPCTSACDVLQLHSLHR